MRDAHDLLLVTPSSKGFRHAVPSPDKALAKGLEFPASERDMLPTMFEF